MVVYICVKRVSIGDRKITIFIPLLMLQKKIAGTIDIVSHICILLCKGKTKYIDSRYLSMKPQIIACSNTFLNNLPLQSVTNASFTDAVWLMEVRKYKFIVQRLQPELQNLNHLYTMKHNNQTLHIRKEQYLAGVTEEDIQQRATVPLLRVKITTSRNRRASPNLYLKSNSNFINL